MIRTQGLYHIQLIVRDLGRSIGFYQSVFGMTELFRVGPKMVFLNTPGSQDLITLHEDAKQPDLAGENGGVVHFGFKLAEGADLDDAIAQVEAAGGRLAARGEHAPGVGFAYVEDLDGYLIEL